jgi:hypothetical protein
MDEAARLPRERGAHPGIVRPCHHHHLDEGDMASALDNPLDHGRAI